MLSLLSLVQGTSPGNLTCPGGGSPQTYYANYEYNEYYPVITQNPTTPLSITLGSTQPNADAFWLHNDDGDLIAFECRWQRHLRPHALSAGGDHRLSHHITSCIIAFVFALHYRGVQCHPNSARADCGILPLGRGGRLLQRAVFILVGSRSPRRNAGRPPSTTTQGRRP